jgi:hypothetical protein
MCVQRELYLDVIVLNINKFFPFFKKNSAVKVISQTHLSVSTVLGLKF